MYQIKNMDKFIETCKNCRKNPELYRTGVFYTTPDNSKIESLYEDDVCVLGIICESPFTIQIGFINIFVKEELIKL